MPMPASPITPLLTSSSLQGFAKVTKMLDLKVNVGIGTDGPASNNDLDMIEEIRLASMVAKCESGDPTCPSCPPNPGDGNQHGCQGRPY